MCAECRPTSSVIGNADAPANQDLRVGTLGMERQQEGSNMTAALVLVAGLAFIAGLVAVMIRLERAQRRLIERRREAWKAEGGVGRDPNEFMGGGGGGGFSPPGGGHLTRRLRRGCNGMGPL